MPTLFAEETRAISLSPHLLGIGYELLPHPRTLQILNVRFLLVSKHEKVTRRTVIYFEDLQITNFSDRFPKLENSLVRRIKLEGDHAKK